MVTRRSELAVGEASASATTGLERIVFMSLMVIPPVSWRSAMKNETADIRRSRLNGQQCNAWCRTTTIDNLDRCCAQETIVRGMARGHPLFLSP